MSEAALTLETCLPVLEAALAYVAHRYHLSTVELEELRGDVTVRLLERDGLAAFQHRSTLRTYLVTVVHHALQDLRDKQWQKWRPSVEAKRLGPVAIRLEQLLVRDGYGFDQACEILRTNHAVRESESALASLCERLPHRARRRFVGEEEIEKLSTGSTPDAAVLETEQRLQATRLSEALEKALCALGAEDRLVLKMHFYDGVRIAEIARVLGLDQKRLYRRLDQLLGILRAALVGEGFQGPELATFLDDVSDGIPAVFGRADERTAAKPT